MLQRSKQQQESTKSISSNDAMNHDDTPTSTLESCLLQCWKIILSSSAQNIIKQLLKKHMF